MTLSRRDFLAASAVSAGMPAVFQRMALAAPKAGATGAADTILVVVQLSGGNDGINTVIPFRDPLYAAARPALKQSADRVLKIDKDLALHPEMAGFAKLLESQRLTILQGVGYPQPNRSHFESMDIWHKATVDAQERYGWIGRTCGVLKDAGAGAFNIGDGEPPLAMFGSTGYSPTFQSLSDYQLKLGSGQDADRKRATIEAFARQSKSTGNNLLSFIESSADQTYAAAERLRTVAEKYDTPITYPETPLANRLKLMAQLISAGVPERIYYASLDGFDTHAGQAISHGGLLRTFSEALLAFHDDLKHQGQADRVVTLVFSEFGRRVKENGSQGTDHGAAAPAFLIGSKLVPGPFGKHPPLDDLDDGDLKFKLDFRQIYATLLGDWLKVDPSQVLKGQYDRLPIWA